MNFTTCVVLFGMHRSKETVQSFPTGTSYSFLSFNSASRQLLRGMHAKAYKVHSAHAYILC